MSAASVKSKVVPATLLSATTATMESNANEKASSALAPAPSNDAPKAVTAPITCCATFSTASASAAFTPDAYGLKVKGSTPAGSPSAVATSEAVKAPPDFVTMVVVGVTTVASFGAESVNPEAEAPVEASTVPASATATTS